jgi:SNF2 family DNA or RNA helicase
MGLGKTLQTICVLAHFLERGSLQKALVVAPTTLLGNWQAEFERFAPKISVSIYHGPHRRLSDAAVTITSYGTLRSDQDLLCEAGFDLVVIDEAQNIKNPDSAQTRAVYRLAQVPYRLALSGTPVENRLLELWSIFRFLNPGLLGNRKKFIERFARPIEFLGDDRALSRLRRTVAPFVLRREKSDPSIVPDLPEKIEKDEWCFLTERQAALYQQVVEEIMKNIEGSEGIERRGLVLKLISLLKQICAHPALYYKHRTGKPEDSGKFLCLLEILHEIRGQKEKVLIFSQFRSMGELICHEIEKIFGQRPFFLHGGVPRKRREEMVAQFESGKEPFVFVLSLKAGGTGLNLVSATHVVHYDLWWNPAVEAQATDRAYRIGQKHSVMVHRLLTRHTLEERINELLLKKKDLAKSIVSSGEKWLTELSDRELKELVSLGAS